MDSMISSDSLTPSAVDAKASLPVATSPAVGRFRVWMLAGVAFGLLCLAAQVRVPVPGSPVPMTLQSLVVLLIGFTMSPRSAMAATLAYVVAGTAGLPILVNPAGLSGITGGYLVGFVLAASLIAGVRGRDNAGYVRLLLAALAGIFMILACGVVWQSVGFGGSWRAALGVGFLPFVGKSVIEALLAVALVRAGRTWFAGRSTSKA